MPHPQGGQGNMFQTQHTFDEAYAFVGVNGVEFESTTGEQMRAEQGIAQDGITPTIVLNGERHIHGRVCHACWGYRQSCTGERIGQGVEPLDDIVA